MSDKVFTMRIDENLLEKLRVSAEKNKRSIAKEIEYILERWYEEPEESEMREKVRKIIQSLTSTSETSETKNLI